MTTRTLYITALFFALFASSVYAGDGTTSFLSGLKPVKSQLFVGYANTAPSESGVEADLLFGGAGFIWKLPANLKLRVFGAIGRVNPAAEGKPSFTMSQAGTAVIIGLNERLSLTGGVAMTNLHTPKETRNLPTILGGPVINLSNGYAMLTPVGYNEAGLIFSIQLAKLF